MPTFIAVAVFGGAFVLSSVLWIVMLRIGLHLAHFRDVTNRQVALSTVIMAALNLVCLYCFLFLGLMPPKIGLPLGISIVCLISFPVVAMIFRPPFTSSIIAWLPTLLSPAVVVAFMQFIVHPFLFELFHNPANSMAPTLLGRHWEAKCGKCGSPCYGSRSSVDDSLAICRDHFHIAHTHDHPQTVFEPDRFLVAKFITPQRWDIVVYRCPFNPSIVYVSRLVGLPGEVITIQDGQVCANGSKLVAPSSLEELKYVSRFLDDDRDLSGAETRPADLGRDEYFVLGDFTERAHDSRAWTSGAKGHNRFAVPRSHIIGVVSHLYWPLNRLRILR